jgi:hypothetical protein
MFERSFHPEEFSRLGAHSQRVPQGGWQEAWNFPSRDFTRWNGRIMKEKDGEVKKERAPGRSSATELKPV